MGNDEATELAAEEEVFDCRSTSIFKSSSSAGSGPGAGRSSVAPGIASEPPYLLMTSLAALGKTLNIINHDHIRDSRVLPTETQTMKPLPVPGFYDKLGLFALMYKACGSAVHA
jgi:hypothetical protein